MRQPATFQTKIWLIIEKKHISTFCQSSQLVRFLKLDINTNKQPEPDRIASKYNCAHKVPEVCL